MAEKDRIEREETSEDMHMADVSTDHRSPPSTPRWVKVFGIIAIIVILLLVISLVTGVGGEHGPARHIPSGDSGGHTAPIERGMQQL